MFLEVKSAITGEPFNTWIDQNRNLILFQPYYLISENKYQIKPNSNDAIELNKFYSVYNNGIEGSKEECLKLIETYKL